MTRIYRYILETDSGMAPCIDHGIVSLATCKPDIRKGARPGDWVLGFRPGSARRGLVVWAGRVARIFEVGEYERKYSCVNRRGRSDAIYRETSEERYERLLPCYHPGEKQFRKDTRSPVLMFDPEATWYFGSKPRLMPEHIVHLAAAGQGFRVNGTKAGDPENLRHWLLSIALADVHNPPTDRRLFSCLNAGNCLKNASWGC